MPARETPGIECTALPEHAFLGRSLVMREVMRGRRLLTTAKTFRCAFIRKEKHAEVHSWCVAQRLSCCF